MAICPHCGREVPDDAIVCPYCGTQLSPDVAICGNCGRLIPADAKVCPYCGAELSDTARCPNCGREIPATSESCPYCGFRFDKDHPLVKIEYKKIPAQKLSAPISSPVPTTSHPSVEFARNKNEKRNLIISLIAIFIAVLLILLFIQFLPPPQLKIMGYYVYNKDYINTTIINTYQPHPVLVLNFSSSLEPLDNVSVYDSSGGFVCGWFVYPNSHPKQFKIERWTPYNFMGTYRVVVKSKSGDIKLDRHIQFSEPHINIQTTETWYGAKTNASAYVVAINVTMLYYGKAPYYFMEANWMIGSFGGNAPFDNAYFKHGLNKISIAIYQNFPRGTYKGCEFSFKDSVSSNFSLWDSATVVI